MNGASLCVAVCSGSDNYMIAFSATGKSDGHDTENETLMKIALACLPRRAPLPIVTMSVCSWTIKDVDIHYHWDVFSSRIWLHLQPGGSLSSQ